MRRRSLWSPFGGAAIRWLIDTAGSVTGTRFRLVIASSSTATALIIGSTLASGGDSGLASQLAQALSALGGSSPSTPAATTPASTPSTATASKGGGAAPVSSIPVSTPSPTPTSTTKTPKTRTPKAGRVKHVFVISLFSPGYDNAFGTQSQIPYLANTLRPQGELLSDYTLLTDKGLPNYIAMIGGQAPHALTSTDCAAYTDYPGDVQPDRDGNVAGNGCIYPAPAVNPPDPPFRPRVTWGAYREDMGKREPVPRGEPAPANPPQNCVRPDVNAADPTQDARKADPGSGYSGSGYA